mmetsp:Transcript_8587/g.21365  ORF Transcript_8587/g.21365 Transcript_8587/m.21365 type:complete len:208 (-) Transcript_8587:65-688(-)
MPHDPVLVHDVRDPPRQDTKAGGDLEGAPRLVLAVPEDGVVEAVASHKVEHVHVGPDPVHLRVVPFKRRECAAKGLGLCDARLVVVGEVEEQHEVRRRRRELALRADVLGEDEGGAEVVGDGKVGDGGARADEQGAGAEVSAAFLGLLPPEVVCVDVFAHGDVQRGGAGGGSGGGGGGSGVIRKRGEECGGERGEGGGRGREGDGER